MSDLSSIIPNVPNSGFSGEFPGLSIPNGARNPLDECGTCPRRLDGANLGTHHCWKSIGLDLLDMGGTLRNWQQACVNENNGQRERLRRLQRLVDLCHTQAEGISSLPDPEYDSMAGTDISMSNGMICTLNGLNGNLINITSSYNPLAVPYQVVSGSTENSDGSTSYSYTTVYCVLPKGVLYLQWPSQLYAHGGFLVRLAPGQTIQGEPGGPYTYNLLTDTPIGPLALTPLPGQSGAIIGIMQYYATYAEPWIPIRDAYPLFALPTTSTATFTSVGPAVYNIGAFRIPAGLWSLSPNVPGAKVKVTQTAYGYSSWLDLTAATLTGINSVTLTYHAEDTAGTNSSAVIVGENRCRYSMPDYTCAVGVASSEIDPLAGGMRTINYYCAHHADLGDSSPFTKNFMPECYQTACPYFDVTPTSTWPVSEAVLAQLIDSYPWTVAAPPPGASGDSGYTYSRAGTPSLASLAGRNWTNLDWAGEQQYEYNQLAGGWPQGLTLNNILQSVNGFEFLLSSSDGTPLSLETPAKWLPGPANTSGVWSRWSEYGAPGTAAAPGDPQQLEISTPMTGGSFVNRVTGGISSKHGWRQRFVGPPYAEPGYQVFFPQVPASAPAPGYTVKGSNYQTGYWDVNGLPVTDKHAAAYVAKITLAPFEMNSASSFSGQVTTATIFASDGVTGGVLTLALSHQTVSASYQTTVDGSTSTVTVSWQQGNRNIKGPDFAEIRNVASQPITGIARTG